MMFTFDQKLLLLLGIIMGFTAVAAGAFGAHALKQKLSPEMLSAFEVGVRYQMYHALAMCLSVWLSTVMPGMLGSLSGWLFFGGTLLFSGSLYLLSLTGIRFFGAVTPIGGVLLLAGWLCLAILIFKS